MKILAIRGMNLASLEGEFDIDFQKEPLLSSGIYAITGCTGSGKSTILDALCLALFEKMPRHRNSSGNASIKDVNGDEISISDPKNILRKGTSAGYAEVELLSLNGDKYRSRWSVRRARNKADGSFQATEITLFNLTANTQEQGTKTTLLERIRALIGMTFDQFTRSVLLAQGDFATFLKADRNAKAELLEKLTGTDIYSSISKIIYRLAKEANDALKSLTERIGDIELLDDQQLEEFSHQLTSLNELQSKLSAEIDLVKSKIRWWEEDSSLHHNIREAEEELDKIRLTIHENQKRKDYLSSLERFNEIRDSYRDTKNLKCQIDALNKAISDSKNLIKEKEDELTSVAKSITDAEESYKKAQNQFELQKPNITRADILDKDIIATTSRFESKKKDLSSLSLDKNKYESELKADNDQLQKLDDRKQATSKWLAEHPHHKEIADQKELICDYIFRANSKEKEIIGLQNKLETLSCQLQADEKKLSECSQEAQRLDSLLPSEIMSLRAKLVEGTPCPVCGSIHHSPLPLAASEMDEKQLDAAKKETKAIIDALKENIDTKKQAQNGYNTTINNHRAEAQEYFTKVSEKLAHFSGWESMYHDGTLSESLDTIAKQWASHDKEIKDIELNITAISSSHHTREELLKKTNTSLSDKKVEFTDLEKGLNTLRKERATLLDGKEITVFENEYNSLISSLKDTIAKYQRTHASLDTEIKGLRNKIKDDGTSLTGFLNSLDSLGKSISSWQIKNGYDPSENTVLEDFISKDNSWIESEQTFFRLLEGRRITAETTLRERRASLERHNLEKVRPSEQETQEYLAKVLSEYNDTFRIQSEKVNDLSSKLTIHNQNKDKVAKLEKELQDKRSLSESWAQLNFLLGSADGNKFRIVAQGCTLDILLTYANIHLSEISRRYTLQRIPGENLALQVADNDMLGEVRPVNTLSGGETFLVSLALALGLSSLTTDRMSIGSLFIDEGFGSLDSETLNIAMDALDRLRATGRQIGVISHVTEMMERISTRIKVCKLGNGRSKIEIESSSMINQL